MSVSTTASRPKEPHSLHDILVAWQAGRMTSRNAMRLTGIDHLSGLNEAARSSAVPIRKTLLPFEARAAERATAAINSRMSKRSAGMAGNG